MRLDDLKLERTAVIPNTKLSAERADLGGVRIRPGDMGNGFGPHELVVPISRTKYIAAVPAYQVNFMDVVLTSTKPTVVLLSFESAYSDPVDLNNFLHLFVNGVQRVFSRGGPIKRQAGLRAMQVFWPFTPTPSDLNKLLRLSIQGSAYTVMNHAVWEVR
jgi:hypothetical protein